MSAVILQDEILHFEVLGRGRPLIFLHGWVGSWRYWMTTMQSASFSFRAYAMDLWGFGDSAKCPPKYKLSNQIDLLNDFMDKMGIVKTALIGHGLGAAVALNFASQFPEMVDRIMLVSLPLNSRTIHPRLRSSTPTDLADWLLARQPSFESARSEAPKTDGSAIEESIISLQDLDLLELSLRLTTPCLFVHGQNDPAIEAPVLENNATIPEHIHQILFEQSGHFPMLDETSKFNRLLADFLALSSGTSPRQLQLKEEWKRRVR